MNDITYMRSLEDKVNLLLVDNKRLEEERAEIEEAENDTRYLCQRYLCNSYFANIRKKIAHEIHKLSPNIISISDWRRKSAS